MTKSYKEILEEAKQSSKAASVQSKKDFVKSVQAKYGSTTREVDPEEYPERKGLEGPFRFKNGQVLYYDAKEGSYYDSKKDHFVEPPKQ